MTNVSVKVGGFTWTVSTELLARLVERAPDLWTSHPELALGFAFGPPDHLPDDNLKSALALPNGKDSQEWLIAPSFPEELGHLCAAAEAISDERREKMNRMKRAHQSKDYQTVLQISSELCGMSYEKEKGC